jgi:peptidoglycan hydrolase-like amidase
MLSTRFSVRRDGNRFIFDGTGHGHGVGLCQTGTRARAQAGQPLEAILSHYFPGTRLERRRADAAGAAIERLADGSRTVGLLLPSLP